MATRFAFPSFVDEPLDSDALNARLAIMLPMLIAAVMLVIGYAIGNMAGIDGSLLFSEYLFTGGGAAFICALAYVFISIVKLARRLEDDPLPRVWSELRAKAPMLLLPALIFPLFLCGFTTAKASIPIVVGFRWDAFWADADKLIFGADMWRVTHQLLGLENIRTWEWLYSAGWGMTIILYKANVPIYCSPRRAGIIYTAMLLTWLIGGWLMAYAMSAAGPIFAHLFDPSLADRFAPLRAALDAHLPADSPTRLTQVYLVEAMNTGIAYPAGGISAMPSMHIGAVTIYVLSARSTKWLVPAIAYWIVIFFGSAYFGYHYLVDGLVAAAVAWGCWKLAEFCFRAQPRAALAFAFNRKSLIGR